MRVDGYFLLGSIVLASFCSGALAVSAPCALKDVPQGYVCVCNATYCDALDDFHPKEVNEYVMVSSSKDGLRFSVDRGVIKKSILSRLGQLKDIVSVQIKVDRDEKFQSIVGFGGAITGAVAHNLDLMTPDVQDQVYRSFYSKEGIDYSMMRYTIGGCDFDLAPWAYNELPINDLTLSNFTSLDERDYIKIAHIKRLMEVTNNKDIKIIAAAWSPPPWMKSNGKWTGYSHLKKQYYEIWAEYHLRFVQYMSDNGIDIWAMSTGNEPNNGVITFPFVDFMSLGWTPSNQAIWLADHFGPLMKSSKFDYVKLFGNDDQRPTYPGWFEKMAESRPESVNYLDGLAVHWYMDDMASPTVYDATHSIYPDKPIINTESCAGAKPMDHRGPVLGSWKRAESYVRSYMQDLKHWLGGWLDWNIALDEQGGPNYANNFVDAPVILNTTTGQEFYKQPIYYAIGHFSKFIPEGSIRISSFIEASEIPHDVDVTSFLRPDGTVVVILFNGAKLPTKVVIKDKQSGLIHIDIPANSVHSIVYQ